jgi:F5/8 type C domain
MPMPSSPSRRLAPWLLAGASYTALAIVLTWPLAARLSSVLPHDLGDPVLNTWILWWNAHAVPLTTRWWNAPFFWPAQGALAMSEHLIGVSLVASPIQWMGASPVTAYNVMFLLSFPLSALAAHALGHTLTGRHDAAAIAGLAFGFNPYRMSQISHLQMLWAFWMPMALLALHRYVRGGGRRWLVLFGAAWLGEALANGYYLMFFPVLIALWLLWFVEPSSTPRRLAPVIAAWALASVPLLPFLWTYYRVHQHFNAVRGIGEIRFFSADVASLASASPLLSLWTNLSSHFRPEQQVFPGLTVCLIVAIAAAERLRGSHDRWRHSRVQAVALAGACALVVIALSPVLFGPWAIQLGRLTVISVASWGKPLSIAMWCGVIALVSGPRFKDALRKRTEFAFYACAAAAMYVLSFGPEAQFLDATFWYRAPYAVLMLVPGYDGMRVPARFAMLGVLCISMAAAIGFAHLTRRISPWIATAAAAVAIGGVLADSWIRALPLPELPVRLALLESLPSNTPVLELPLGHIERDTAAMYRAMYHRRRLVNGYSGFAPAAYVVAGFGLAAGEGEVFDAIASEGPLVVVADETDGNGAEWSAEIARRAGVTLLGVEAGRRVFAVPATPPIPADEPPNAHTIPVQSITTSGPAVGLSVITDGDPNTHWKSATSQRGSEFVALDLGSIKVVNGLTLAMGSHPADYPRELAIDISTDAHAWTTVWRGPTAGRATRGAMLNPRDVPLSISIAPATARFVRLRQLGKEPLYPWSIGEVRIFGR